MFVLNLPTLKEEYVLCILHPNNINIMKGSVLASRITSAYLFLFFLISIAFQSSEVSAQPDGAALFKAQCAQCHSTGETKVIGPGLKNIHSRRNEAWLLKWIKNSADVIKSGDEYGVKLF